MSKKPAPEIAAEDASLNAAFKLARRQLGTLNSAEIVHLRALLRGNSVAEAVTAIRQARYAPNPPPRDAAPEPEAKPKKPEPPPESGSGSEPGASG